MKRLTRIGMITAISVVMLLAVTGLLAAKPEAAPDGAPLQTAAWSTKTFYGPIVLTSTATKYTACPLVQSGLDICSTAKWTNAEVFLTIDVSTTGSVTLTPQFSADASNWSTSTAATAVLSTNVDSTVYNVVTLAGGYTRFAIDSTATATKTITTTIKVVLKNP